MTALRTPWVRWLLAALVLLGLVLGNLRSAAGAVGLGNAASSQGTGVSSLSWSHTVGAGSDRLLVVRVANINSSVTVNNVTYGGVAMTALQTATSGSGTSQVRISMWYLVAPAVGTATVAVTLSASTRVQGYSNNLTGVSQVAPFGTPVTAVGTNNAQSVTVTGGVSGDLIMDAGAAQGGAGTASAGTGQTAVSGSTGPTASDVLGMGSTKAAAASVSMAWSTTASSPWVLMGVAIKQSVPTLYLGGTGVPTATLSATAPTGALGNPDPGRDAAVGLYLQKGGSGVNETDPAKVQTWLTPAGTASLSGTVQLVMWTAMKDFRTDKAGALTAYLLNCDGNGANCTTLATATSTSSPWTNSNTWVQKTFSFGSQSTTLASGRRLGVRIIVPDASDDDMKLAYGAALYPSRLEGVTSVPSTSTISGTVFEDVNYGGGPGRSLATSSGVGRSGATVELYNSSGIRTASTTTASNGSYSFTGLAAGNWYVRVVSGTVSSSRYTSGTTPLGVMTFRTTATSGSAVAVTDFVGGTNPAVVDPGVAPANSAFNTSTGVYSAGLSGTAHAWSQVTLGAANVSGVDFGFNFDTVVNVRGSGQGSLLQAVTNANVLGSDNTLAQSGRTAGREHIVFMIPNGSTGAGGSLNLAAGGLRSSLNYFSGGVATITPRVTMYLSTPMVLDAQTQPGWTANPIVELTGTGAAAGSHGLELSAGPATVRGLVVNNWPAAGLNAWAGSGHVIQGNWFGLNNTGTAAAGNGSEGVNLWSTTKATVGGTTPATRNVLSGNGNNGLVIAGPSDSTVVTGNYIGLDAAGGNVVRNGSLGIYVNAPSIVIGGTADGAGNVISGNTYAGIMLDAGSDGSTVQGNRIGTDPSGKGAMPNGGTGVDIYSAKNTVGGTVPEARNLISGNGYLGVNVTGGSAAGNIIQGNYIGTNADGSAGVPNAAEGVVIESPGNTVGGSAKGAGNLISGNAQFGVSVRTKDAADNTVQGNIIGLNATGDAALSNGSWGLVIDFAAPGTQVVGNVISGNTQAGWSAGIGGIYLYGSNTSVRANIIGMDPSGSKPFGNGGKVAISGGIYVNGGSTGVVIGGTTAADANIIAGNVGGGVVTDSTAVQAAILGNSIHSNSSLGIDLRNDGTSGNDGAKSGGQPNQMMDSPVFTTASLAGTTLTVKGYVGSAAGQSTFGSARVEIFTADSASRTASGQTYLGFLTANADGSFSGALNGVSGLTAGVTQLTATATDGGGNTSEFGSGFTVAAALAISGTVFEDVNYGGGAGRALATALAAGGQRRPNARVELFRVSGSSGTVVAVTTTDATGAYKFDGLDAATYQVRVVNGSVTSSRNAAATGVLPVVTFHADGSGSTVTPVTNEVGGAAPASTARASTNSNVGGTQPSSQASSTAEGIATVTLTTVPLSGIDFGFNFSTIVNTNDSGQGSLRQFIVNANALGGEAALAQSGRSAGVDSSIFVLPTSSAGYIAATQHWRITPLSALPGLTSPLTVIDGSTQAGTVLGNLWAGIPHTLKVELHGNGLGTTGLGVWGANSGVRGLVIGSFGDDGVAFGGSSNNFLRSSYIGVDVTGSNTASISRNGVLITSGTDTEIGGLGNSDGNVIAGNGSSAISSYGGVLGLALRGNFIGSNAAGMSVLGSRSRGYNNVNGTVTFREVRRNLWAGNTRAFVTEADDTLLPRAGQSSWAIAGNHFGIGRDGLTPLPNGGAIGIWDAAQTFNVAGLVIGGTVAADRNLITNNTAYALYLRKPGTGLVVQGNYIGVAADGSTAAANTGDGLYIETDNAVTVGGTAGNTIANSAGRGINVVGSTAPVIISRNSMYGNGSLGIDLGNDGLTANDGAKTSGSPNQLMDSPVISTAAITGTTLTLTGYVGSAAGQALFAGATVEIFVSDDDASGAGEGRTWLGSLTADASGNFSGSITGVTISNGAVLTGTATDAQGNTSEFGANFTTGRTIGGVVFEDRNYGGGAGRDRATALAAGGRTLAGVSVELYSGNGTLVATATTAGDGSYSFPGVAADHFFVRVVTSTVRSARTGNAPGQWPVQTWRYEASWQTPAAVTDEVGGARPDTADSGSNPAMTWTLCTDEYNNCVFTGTRLVRYGLGSTWTMRVATGGVACDNGVFGDPLVGTVKRCDLLDPHLHSVSSVSTVDAGASGLDFGYHFSTVVNTNDSGQGSLRQAIANANALGDDGTLATAGRTAGIEHVVFMLSNGSSGGGGSLNLAGGLRTAYNFFSGGVATVVPVAGLPPVATAMVIDAQAQPGWTAVPVVRLDGSATSGSTAGLQIGATGSAVRGLAIGGFYAGVSIWGGGSHVIAGNHMGIDAAGSTAAGNRDSGIYIGSSTSNVIGGLGANDRNVISGNTKAGIYLDSGSNGTVIRGNHIGTNREGTAAVGNNTGNGGYAGIDVASSANVTIGGDSAAARNVISGNLQHGVRLFGSTSSTVLHGNTIGLNAAGTAAVANRGDGIQVTGSATGTQIGGSAAGQGNVVSGNADDGIDIGALTRGTTIRGNLIGTNAAGTAGVPNADDGIEVQGGSANTIGGTGTGEGNRIAFNGDRGVLVSGGSGAAILGNTVDSNGSIGIDLGNNGVTANDGAKTSGGPNQLMDHPVITEARARGDQLTLKGHVGSAAGQSLFGGVRVEFFESDNDPSGFGEGRRYLGALTTRADGTFDGTLTMPVSALRMGTRLTGTATDSSGNTSEFGAQFTGLVVDFVVNTNADDVDADIGDGQCLTAAGFCSLRAAIAELNAWTTLPQTPTVAFAIPGCTAQAAAGCTITPATALPTVARAMVIDAQTQPGWTLAPWVELMGSNGPSFANGLSITAAGTTVRGLVIGGFGQAGILINANDVVIEGNVIGLQPDGQTARRNGPAGSTTGGIQVAGGTGIVIGGVQPAQRNVLSGNGGAGLWVANGTVTVLGNRIGTNADGTAAVGNGRWGISSAGGTGHRIGGMAPGEGNVVSGNVAGFTGGIFVAGSSVTVQGNLVGLNAAGTSTLPNGGGQSAFDSGIDLRGGSNHLVEGNQIVGNQGHGVRVTAQASRILSNSIHGNLWLGIDLNADGVTANDGTLSSAPNAGMDHPVIAGAGVDTAGTALRVFGHVGTGTGNAVFANSRVEIFRAAPDGSGHGEGQVLLGVLTADGQGQFSGTLTIPAGQVVVGDPLTATATHTAGNTSEFGPNWATTTMAALTPAGFDAFDSGTAAGSTSGPLTTRVAGVAGTVDVVALASTGPGLHPGFSGTVTLTWIDARNDSGAVSGSCRSSWIDVAPAGSAVFSNASRASVNVTAPTTGTRVMRLKMVHTSSATPPVTTTACSGDALAIIPARFTLAATDADAASPGTTRALDNASAAGGVVHRAGRPFTVRAEARDAGDALMTAYDGTPLLATAGCALPAGCTAATLTVPASSATGGVWLNNAVSYAEVGAVSLRLTDTAYADVDATDTAAAARRIESALVTAGRFVPDSLTASVTTDGRFATANGACLAAGSGATFIGQGFGWATPPRVTLTARNAAGAITSYWSGALMKLAPGGGIVPDLQVSGTGGATLSRSFGAFGVSDLGGGLARLDASSTDRFLLDLPAGSVTASLTPAWGWSLAVTDASEAAVAGNPSLSTSATQLAVPFDLGSVFHSGRLMVAPAHGDARSGVRPLLHLQRWSDAGWVTMTEDRGCVTVSPQHLGVESATGVFDTAGLCAAPVAAAVTTAGGRAWLTLPGTPNGQHGRQLLRLAGAAAVGNACAPGATPVQALPLPWLLGGSTGTGPAALLTWGSPNRDTVLRRETW